MELPNQDIITATAIGRATQPKPPYRQMYDEDVQRPEKRYLDTCAVILQDSEEYPLIHIAKQMLNKLQRESQHLSPEDNGLLQALQEKAKDF